MTYKLKEKYKLNDYSSFNNYILSDSEGKVVAKINRLPGNNQDDFIEITYGTDWSAVGNDGKPLFPPIKSKLDLIRALEAYYGDTVVEVFP